ncbi:MAG: hypothetical protein NVS2B16_10560 [Chloroflexota bacterium]
MKRHAFDLIVNTVPKNGDSAENGDDNPDAAHCFACGQRVSSKNSLCVRGSSEDASIQLHATCALGFSIQLLAELERSQLPSHHGDAGIGADLSPRERQVLDGIVRGERDREIADRLGIAEHTVKNHAYDVRHKIGARSRTDAAVRAVRAGIVVETRPARAPDRNR